MAGMRNGRGSCGGVGSRKGMGIGEGWGAGAARAPTGLWLRMDCKALSDSRRALTSCQQYRQWNRGQGSKAQEARPSSAGR